MDEAIEILNKEIAELSTRRQDVLSRIQGAAREVNVWQENVRMHSRQEETLGLKIERLVTARDTLKAQFHK